MNFNFVRTAAATSRTDDVCNRRLEPSARTGGWTKGGRGATLLVNIWAISRDQSSWPEEPLAFKPERFLAGGFHEGVDVKGGDFELIQFGAGRRICAGMSLGLRMVQFMTATLVHAFDWRLGEAARKLDMEEAYGLTLRWATPLVAIPCLIWRKPTC
ncbi:Flavonoid 3'-monooxygenase [Platanthera guangdongensis]|uniref:Flavonoid 3'-monooxygenase n=1 Tax=Platanthera guangdongensis TaxID=2320717 RepID=A0ABR2ME97_9ASPA